MGVALCAIGLALSVVFGLAWYAALFQGSDGRLGRLARNVGSLTPSALIGPVLLALCAFGIWLVRRKDGGAAGRPGRRTRVLALGLGAGGIVVLVSCLLLAGFALMTLRTP